MFVRCHISSIEKLLRRSRPKVLCEKILRENFAKFLVKQLYGMLCPKMDLAEMYYYQTIKLGTQSKLYEQNYSQMIFAI